MALEAPELCLAPATPGLFTGWRPRPTVVFGAATLAKIAWYGVPVLDRKTWLLASSACAVIVAHRKGDGRGALRLIIARLGPAPNVDGSSNGR